MAQRYRFIALANMVWSEMEIWRTITLFGIVWSFILFFLIQIFIIVANILLNSICKYSVNRKTNLDSGSLGII